MSRFIVALPLLLALAGPAGPAAQERRWVVAFANVTEGAGITLEGTGFTGRDVRKGFELAARRFPIDLVVYDNQRDRERSIANVGEAIGRRVDLYVQYGHDTGINAAIAERLKAAGIPALAVGVPMPGAPLYTPDNEVAGRIAGEALGRFAARFWPGRPLVATLLGPIDADARLSARGRGVADGLHAHVSARLIPLDTHGNPARVAPLLSRLTTAAPGTKILIAALDDATALEAKAALEAAGRLADAAIVSHGCDRSMHGGLNDRKEIDPNNRGSVVLGSVAFYLDRWGDDVLPLAVKRLRGETVAPRTTTRHVLITAANVFIEYPPSDMN